MPDNDFVIADEDFLDEKPILPRGMSAISSWCDSNSSNVFLILQTQDIGASLEVEHLDTLLFYEPPEVVLAAMVVF